MLARVREDSEQRIITCCSGREFVKSEWRPVPPGFEAEAARCPFLEVKDPTVTVVKFDVVPNDQHVEPLKPAEEIADLPKPVELPKPAAKRKSGGKHG